MATNPNYQETEKISVELLLTSGNSIRVNLFVSGMQRVNDLLNDGRAFIPFEDISGQLRLVNKAMIITVIPSDQGTGAKAGSAAEDVPQEAPPPPADAR
jgi:hypothetical protein